ncbi:Adenosine specific kinase [mine drainage metagenome]|uniref:Adenosine specific kinase n=1 Tax=mine drainage metagenome TaxID=410659 RepID=T1C0T2_9ZZZZ
MAVTMEFISIEKDEDTSIMIGHAGFIKTVEDLYEALTNSVPQIKFGLAFAEASGKRLLRSDGNDETLEASAQKNLMKINSGHTFLILFKGAYPINVVKHIRDVNEVVSVYCATANPVSVVVASDGSRRAVIGISDGETMLGMENDADKKERYELLRKFGYKK